MKSVLDGTELEATHVTQAEEYTNPWPFPVTNGKRNFESQKLLDKPARSVKIKPDLSGEDIALL